MSTRGKILFLLLVLPSCIDIAQGDQTHKEEEPSRPASSGPPVEFSSSPGGSPDLGAEDHRVVVDARPGHIEVKGKVPTGDSCYVETKQANGMIVLRVIARPQGGNVVCMTELAWSNYHGMLGPLGSGTYHVEVVHAYENTGRPDRMVLDQEVQVP
jgi:hypothetical protein